MDKVKADMDEKFPEFGQPLFVYKDRSEDGMKWTFNDCMLCTQFGSHTAGSYIENIFCHNVMLLEGLYLYVKTGDRTYTSQYFSLVTSDVKVGREKEVEEHSARH